MHEVLQDVRMAHDLRILIAAAVVCAIWAGGTVHVYSTIPQSPPRRRVLWLGLAGAVAGSGAWLTHVVAMLAYQTGLSAAFQLGPILGALAVAVAGMTLGLAVGDSPKRTQVERACAGAVVGLSAGAMHYLGMTGYRTGGRVAWDFGGVAVSLGLGVVLAVLAFTLARRQASLVRQACVAALLMLALAGLHFGSLAAATVSPGPLALSPQSLLAPHALTDLAAVTGGLLFILALAGIVLDRATYEAANDRLLKALDAMAEGVALFNPAGRLSAWNARYAELYEGTGIALVQGMAFADLLERSVDVGAFPETAANPTAWLAARTAVYRGQSPEFVVQTSRGRWMRISDRRTPGGGIVSSCVDITELKSVEAALTAARDRAERLAALADRAEALAGLGHLRMDLASGAMEWSQGYPRLLGLDPDVQLTGDLVGASTHPDDRETTRINLRRRLAGELTDGNPIVRIVRPCGEIRHLHATMAVERDSEGRPTAFLTTAVDITELKAAEKALTQARDRAERLTTLADRAEALARIGHWRADLVSGEEEWSPGYARIHGLDPDAPVDTAVLKSMTHPDDLDMANAIVQRLLAGEDFDTAAIARIVRTDGETRYLHGNIALERDADGQPIAMLGTVVDVTELKLAEIAVAESEVRFRNLADNAPDIIAESSPEGVLTYISPACEAITGYAPEELVGRSFTAIMDPDDVARITKAYLAVVETKGAVRSEPVEFRARHKSGEELWLESKLTYVCDPATGRHTGYSDVIRDITPRKRMEAEIEAARAAAEAAAAVKAEFLANMSHELRTPLTSIVGFTAMTAQQKELSEQTRRYVDRVAEASKALLCTVNDILDFSKLEAGQVAIRPEPVQIGALARGALELFAPQAGAKDLELTLDVEDPQGFVALDPDRARQILLNLVGNAVKFTASGAVTLRTRYDRDLQMLTVEVIDTGDGLAPHQLEQLFKRFSQVDGSLTRAQGGTGLGLAICKGLVEAMGGEIGVDSQEGQGSRFWFRIPAPPAAAPGADGVLACVDSAGLEGLKVLVVDDHPANRELARLFLTGAGAQVTEAEDGEAAVSIATQSRFDVILMDLRMPRLDGLGALKQIRAAQGLNRGTPVVAFTADLTADLAADLRNRGFDGGVAKPLEAAALLEAVAAAAFEAGEATEDSAAA